MTDPTALGHYPSVRWHREQVEGSAVRRCGRRLLRKTPIVHGPSSPFRALRRAVTEWRSIRGPERSTRIKYPVQVLRATVVVGFGAACAVACSVGDLTAGGLLQASERYETTDADGVDAGDGSALDAGPSAADASALEDGTADQPTATDAAAPTDALFNPDAVYYPAPTAAITIENLQNGRYLNAELGSPTVDTWSYTGGSNQFWTLWWDSNDKTYQIKNQSSGECLDVVGGANYDGDALQYYNCWGGDNQRFYIVNFGRNVQIIGKQSGKCVSSAANIDGAQVYIWDCSNALSQQWAILQ